MERLAERLTDKSYCISDIRAIQKETFYEDMECRRGFDLYTGKAIDKLAEYEDLEEQGKLLKLPCAVGGEVYGIINQTSNYDGTHYRIVTVSNFRLDMLNKIGKTVFLTRQEAEGKLAEMEGKK